jgi:hypothetical protein
MSILYQKHVSTVFQVTLFGIVMSLFCLIAYRPIYQFNAHDPKPDLIANEPELGSNAPTVIRTGLHIRNFSKSDIIKNDFVFEGMIWFEFDPKKIDPADIEKFTIEKGEIIERSTPIMSQSGNHMLAQFTIRARFKTNLNYRAYPLDDHIIYIIFGNHFITAKRAIFESAPDNFTVASDVSLPNGSIEKLRSESGYTESTIKLSSGTKTIQHPRTIFAIETNRIDIRHFLNIFMPLLLIFFFTLFAFSFDFKEHTTTITTIAAAGVPALLAYRFVIETLSPDVNYFMLSDYLFFLFLLLVSLIFLFIAGALHCSQRAKKYIIVSLYAIMLGGCALLFRWFL